MGANSLTGKKGLGFYGGFDTVAGAGCRMKHQLNATTVGFLAALMAFFGVFLFYPLSLSLWQAFFVDGKFTLEYFPAFAEQSAPAGGAWEQLCHRLDHHGGHPHC